MVVTRRTVRLMRFMASAVPAGLCALAAIAANQDMVTVPAGPFRMGSDEGQADERPAHTVELAAFSIDRSPVTNAQFARFLDAAGPRGARGERFFDDDDARIPKPTRCAARGAAAIRPRPRPSAAAPSHATRKQATTTSAFAAPASCGAGRPGLFGRKMRQ